MNQSALPESLRSAGFAILAATPALMVFSREAPPVLAALVALCLAAAVNAEGRRAIVLDRLAGFARRPAAILLGAGLLLMAVSLAWSTAPSRGATHLAHMAGSAVLVAALIACVPERAGPRLASWLCAGIAAGGVLLLANVATAGGLRAPMGLATEAFRLNRAAVAMALLAPAALALAWRQDRWLVALASGTVALAAIAASDSWSAKMAVITMILAAPLAAAAPLRMHRLFTLLIVGSILATPLLAGQVNALLPKAVHDLVGYGSLTIRGEIWREYAALCWAKPILGFGMEASHAVLGLPQVAGLAQERLDLLNYGHPHNAPLQVWFEFGVVGALIAAALVWFALRAMERLPKSLLPLASVTSVGVYTIAYVSHGAWQAWWICLVGLVATVLAGMRGNAPWHEPEPSQSGPALPII